MINVSLRIQNTYIFFTLIYLAYLIGFRKLQHIPTFTTFHLFDFRFVHSKKGCHYRVLCHVVNVSLSDMQCILTYFFYCIKSIKYTYCIFNQFKAFVGILGTKSDFGLLDAFTTVQQTSNKCFNYMSCIHQANSCHCLLTRRKLWQGSAKEG